MPSFIMLGFLIVAFAATATMCTKVYAIDLWQFDVGNAVVGTYTVPSSSRTNINLQDGTGRVVLHVDYRRDWTYQGIRWQNTILVITGNLDGTWNWGNAKTIKNKNYVTGTDITFKIVAKDNDFEIIVNHESITSIGYIVPVNTMSRAYMETEAADCELKSLGVEI